jgi:hypothetical protein
VNEYPNEPPEVYGIESENGETIVETDGGFYPPRAADARLIAAAPDLLSIASRWAAIDGGIWHAERYVGDRAQLMADTQTAIAKATGETP